MSETDELNRTLFTGIEKGLETVRQEAPHIVKEAGIMDPNYAALKNPYVVVPLKGKTLGATEMDTQTGKVRGPYKFNSLIPDIFRRFAKIYQKGMDWVHGMVYRTGKDTAEHEGAHGLSSKVAKGEKFNQNTVDVMESITTFGRYKTKKNLGKEEEAEFIKQNNPYPRSWILGRLADILPYVSETGDYGYRAFIKDMHDQPFYKPIWRLAKQALSPKKGYKKAAAVATA